jgi:hypothetical protein
MGGWVDGWMGGWMELKAVLRIAYSNQKWIYQFYYIDTEMSKTNISITIITDISSTISVLLPGPLAMSSPLALSVPIYPDAYSKKPLSMCEYSTHFKTKLISYYL